VPFDCPPQRPPGLRLRAARAAAAHATARWQAAGLPRGSRLSPRLVGSPNELGAGLRCVFYPP